MLTLSEACERNKGPILEVLRSAFAACRSVLEIGSGTGQHAVHFARHLPHLSWQPTELAAELETLAARLRAEGGANLRAPLALEVCALPWPAASADAIFTANTLHIMGWDGVECFFRGAGRLLPARGLLAVYGPFNYGGRYTSDSNAEFDHWLKTRDPQSGIRDFESLDALAREAGFTLRADQAMPANNRTLLWQRAVAPTLA